VLAAARGHTLFTVEALRDAANREPAGGGLTVPATLREAVLARVRRAGQDVDTLLRAAAVVGAAFEVELLADLLDVPLAVAAERAERALAAHLVVEAGTAYELANDLIREVLYEATPRPTRVARHRRLAALLADRPETAAKHAAASGDWPRAAAALRSAAAAAARMYANRDAERLLTEALDAAALAAGAAAGVDPAAPGGARFTAELLVARGQAREATGDYRGAFADHERAVELAREAGDGALAATALERLGWTGYYARDRAELRDLAERAQGVVEGAAASPAAPPSTLVLAGRIRHGRADLAGARAMLDRALAAAPDPATLAQAHHCLGLLLGHTDHYHDARELLDRAADEARLAGLFRIALTSYFTAALACANQGDLAGALVRADRMGRLLAEIDDPLYHARGATTRSWIWRELGDLARARDLAEEAVDRVGDRADTHPGVHAVLGLAECRLLGGDEAGAAALLDGLPDIDALPFGWRTELRHLAVRSRVEPAVAERLLTLARERDAPKYEALALARLGDRAAAAAAAARTGSDLLVAQVAPAPAARAALDRVAARLPAELRPDFLAEGATAVALGLRG
jgi:tetratricopeptide (TPR) repeat protein